MIHKYGINAATPADWDKLRKDFPAVETSVVLDNTAPKFTADPVNAPDHYKFGKVECIEAIKESMTTEAFKGYCKGNALKYLWRYDYKGKAVEDLGKAEWYLRRLKTEVSEAN